MKKLLTLLIALVAVTAFSAPSISQTNTPVVLRTLRLPNEYAITDTKIIAYEIAREPQVEQYVDLTNFTQVKVNGKWVKTYAPDSFSISVISKRHPHENRTYLPNFMAMRKHEPKTYFNPANKLQVITDFIPASSTANWIAWEKTTVAPDGMLVYQENGLGSNNILKVYKNRAYTQPVDYKGKPIPGKDEPNPGGVSFSWLTNADNPPVKVSLITTTKTEKGETRGTPKSTYILKNELLQLLDLTEEQLAYDLRREYICEVLNPVTHVTSVSSEIVQIGQTCQLTCYVNGYDVSLVSPLKKITSTGQTFPSTIPQIRLFNGETSGSFGTTVTKNFSAWTSPIFTLSPGSVPSFNDATNTLTYNSSIPADLWGLGFVANNNGKQFNQGESINKITEGQVLPKW